MAHKVVGEGLRYVFQNPGHGPIALRSTVSGYCIDSIPDFWCSMKITVKLFAVYQEAYGLPEIVLDLPEGAIVAQVLDRVLAEHPELERWRSVTRFGVNLQFVAAETPLATGDEVVLIPPVSGGGRG